jgi:hypothetical protein
MADTEMDELGEQERGEQERGEQEEETNFDDDDRHGDESILIIDGSNPIFSRVDVEEDADLGIESRVKKMGKSDGKVRRYIIHTKKQFLKDGLGVTVNKGDGPSSTTLYDELRTTTSKKNGKINGALYKGKKILIMKNDKMVYSTDMSKVRYVNEFKELLRKADKEHQKTPAALVEEHVGVDLTQETMEDIISNVSDRIGSEIDDAMEDITTNTEITNNELRELRGILNVKGDAGATKLEAIKVESEHWKKESEKEGDTPKGKLYEAIARVADLKADEIRLRLNQKPVSEEVTNMIEEEAEVNDLTRFERFKKWSRENLLELSAVSISVAGILTDVIMSGRSALKRGAQAVSKFGKAVANVVKKLGPVLSAIGTLVSKVLTLGAQGILFLAQNLWILVLALTYFIYNEYRK